METITDVLTHVVQVHFERFMTEIPQRTKLHNLTGLGTYLEPFNCYYYSKKEWDYLKSLWNAFILNLPSEMIQKSSLYNEKILKGLQKDFEAYYNANTIQEIKLLTLDL